MISFSYRLHWYSLKKRQFNREKFTDCSPAELIALFRYISSPIVDMDVKLAIADWVDASEPSGVFALSSLGRFVGPQENLKGMTIGQWAYIERACWDYNREPTRKNKAKVLASIFLRVGKQFSEKSIETNLKHFERVPDYTLLVAIKCWQNVRQWVYGMYPLVFPVTNVNTANEDPPAPEYGKMIIGLSDGNSDRAIDEIFSSSLHNILSRLQLRLEAEQKKPRN